MTTIADGAEGRFWLIVREPGMVPRQKGPFRQPDTAKVLREFIAANPRAFIDHLTIDADGAPWVSHGPEVLQMTDGRSMSVGRKHNERVREAAEEALAHTVAEGVVERAAREAISLIDEMNELGSSRRFYGIGPGTTGKLATIRSTLAIALGRSPTAMGDREAVLEAALKRAAVNMTNTPRHNRGSAQDRHIGAAREEIRRALQFPTAMDRA